MNRLLIILLSCGLYTLPPTSLVGQALTNISYKLVGTSTDNQATYSSINQKILQNKFGTFMIYKSSESSQSESRWHLLRSTDGGESFEELYTKKHKTKVPVMDDDPNGNIYIMCPDLNTHTSIFYKFTPGNGFTKPAIAKKVPKPSYGKYNLYFDDSRDKMYFFTNGDHFKIVQKNGETTGAYQITRDGNKAHMEYPHISIDEKGKIHAAWTTDDHDDYHYRSIHYMRSNNAWDWKKMNGKNLNTPVIADPSGPTDQIVLNDEFGVQTWLSSFMVRDGKAHFVYRAKTGKKENWRQHYVRYDIKTATRDVDIYPEFKGNELNISSLGGFLVCDKTIPFSTIYYVGHSKKKPFRITCLASDDNGETWYDYAEGPGVDNAYAITGFREITSDGYIIGGFTDTKQTPKSVYFIKFLAGLSTAQLACYSYDGTDLTMGFDNIKGQPEFISFSKDGDSWTDWMPFDTTMTVNKNDLPTNTKYFQLLSKLGVESDIFEIDLSPYQTPTSIQSVTICEGESLFVGGNYHSEPGIYFDVLQSIHGCDSLIMETELNVYIPPIVFDTIRICAGDSIELAGAYRKEEGLYPDTLISALGCDSFLVTQLLMKQVDEEIREVTICDTDSIWLGAAFQNKPGTYLDTIKSSLGCDSLIVTTNLAVEMPQEVYLQDTICAGDSVFLDGSFRRASDTYIDLFQSSNGCDSSVITQLYVETAQLISYYDTICFGDSLWASGAHQKKTGIYRDTVKSTRGCDSLVYATHLTVLPPIDYGQSHVTHQLITNINRNYEKNDPDGGMSGGINEQTRPIITDANGNLWFAFDQGPNRQRNKRIRYQKWDGEQWEYMGSVEFHKNHRIKQNAAHIFIAPYIYSYAIDPEKHRIVECYFNTTDVNDKGWRNIKINGSNYQLPTGSHRIGAAVSPVGTKLIWWSTSGAPGKFYHMWNADDQWKQPVVTNIIVSGNKYTLLREIRAKFSSNTQIEMIGQSGRYNTQPTHPVAIHIAIDIDDSKPKAKFKWLDSHHKAKYPGDIWVNPHNQDLHAITRFDGEKTAYYYKANGSNSWSHIQNLGDAVRARFFDDEMHQTLYLITGGANIQTRAVSTYKLKGSIDWESAQIDTVEKPTGALGKPSAIYVQSNSYQNTAYQDLHFGLTGAYPNKDHNIYHFRYDINPFGIPTQPKHICNGDSIFLEGAYRNTPGIYYDTLIASNGCDSISITELIVNSHSVVADSVHLCKGDSILLAGSYQKTSGIYSDTFVTSTGCDSIVISTLTVQDISTELHNFNICEGESIILGDVSRDTSGTYYDTLQSARGCDSVIRVSTLYVHAPTISNQSASISKGDSILLGGTYQTKSGVYTDSLHSIYGCDSIIVTKLKVLASMNFRSDSICEGDSLFIDNEWITQPGTYFEYSTDANGYENVTSVSVFVKPHTTSESNVGICQGDSILIGDHYYNEPGDYLDTIWSVQNCATIHTTHLNVYPPIEVYDTIITEAGISVFLAGAYRSFEGTYTDSLVNSNSCDSLLMTTLVVESNADTIIEKSICDHDSIIIGGIWRKEEGYYNEVYKTYFGADSIVTIALSIQPAIYSTRVDSICKGDSLLIGNKYHSKPGVYYDTLQNINACLAITKVLIEPQSCNTTGIDMEFRSKHSLQVLPNPSDGVFSIRIDEKYRTRSSHKAKLTDLTGRVMESFSVGNSTIKKDWRKLPGGTYLLKIDNGMTLKLIIQ